MKEKQAAQRQIDINTDSFKLKDQEEKLQAGRYIVELVSAVPGRKRARCKTGGSACEGDLSYGKAP